MPAGKHRTHGVPAEKDATTLVSCGVSGETKMPANLRAPADTLEHWRNKVMCLEKTPVLVFFVASHSRRNP